MSSPVLTVGPDDSALEVAGAMRDAGVNSVVITDAECRPTGILTATDYVTMTSNAVDPRETSVEKYAATDIVTAQPTDSVATAAEVMMSQEIKHLPVVDSDEQVVGIITTTDLAEYLASERKE
jgi:CBS domain-containing protein